MSRSEAEKVKKGMKCETEQKKKNIKTQNQWTIKSKVRHEKDKKQTERERGEEE